MSSTTTVAVVILVVLALVVLALLATFGMRARRSQQLRSRFGPEYDRALTETGGNRAQAEQLLAERVERRKELPIRDLDPAARERYAQEWRTVQAQFVDDPKGAVVAADRLTTQVMRDRGYPAESFEQQVADVSVDHGSAVPGYVRAHEVLTSARDRAATDDLRQAMVHYRDLFAEVLGERPDAVATDGAAPEQPTESSERQAEARARGRRGEAM